MQCFYLKVQILILNLQSYQWQTDSFVKKTHGVQTFHGQSIDFYNYRGQPFIVIGNRYNSISSTYTVTSQIYELTTLQNLYLFGEIVASKIKRMRFNEINGFLYVIVISEMESCKLYHLNESVSGRFYLTQDFNVQCKALEIFTQNGIGTQ